ncbi:MAG TPA: fibronectin type III-like domain-contianing protein, partial [Actinopolymorphaceae bacterium]
TGSRRAAEVAQLYVRRVTPSKVDHPRLKLCGFERVELDPGETARVRLGIGPDAFTHWDVRTNRFVVEPGGFEILVGASSTDVRLSDRWDVVGDPLPPRDLRRRTHARDFDAQQGVRLVPASRLAGDAVQGATGGWIGFHDVDVGALAATELVAVVGSDRGEVLVVRLDDPVNGPMLARLYVPRTSGPYAWAEVHTALTTDVERRAVRDLYLVFGGPARIADLWCEGSEPGDVRRPARPGSP